MFDDTPHKLNVPKFMRKINIIQINFHSILILNLKRALNNLHHHINSFIRHINKPLIKTTTQYINNLITVKSIILQIVFQAVSDMSNALLWKVDVLHAVKF